MLLGLLEGLQNFRVGRRCVSSTPVPGVGRFPIGLALPTASIAPASTAFATAFAAAARVGGSSRLSRIKLDSALSLEDGRIMVESKLVAIWGFWKF